MSCQCEVAKKKGDFFRISANSKLIEKDGERIEVWATRTTAEDLLGESDHDVSPSD